MLSKLKILSVLALSGLLASCATGYHAKKFSGGYSEIITNQDSFIVKFEGNRFTSSEKVHEYALKRASELALKNGYNYFTVLSMTDCSKKSTQTHTEEHSRDDLYALRRLARGSYASQATKSTYTEDVISPAVSLKIRCFKEKIDDPDLVDATFFLANNS